MSTIYVVFGKTGEYSDYTEWPVKAFKSEERAIEFVEEVSAEYRKLRDKYGTYMFDGMIKAGDKNHLDPHMGYDHVTGTEYEYFPLELEE